MGLAAKEKEKEEGKGFSREDLVRKNEARESKRGELWKEEDLKLTKKERF